MEVKHKTSLNLSEKLWKDWVQYVVVMTGSTMKISRMTEQALREYMDRNPIP